MKKHLVIAVALVLASSAAGAQGLTAPRCISGGSPSQNAAQDACQQAYDVYQFMAPQLGVALAGGNATLGQGSTLGGIGHISVGLRGNFFSGTVPKIDQFTQRASGASPARELPTKSQLLGAPTADVAIGLFGGLPLALTNVGGVDLLVSAAYVPTIGSAGSDFYLKPDQNLQFGYGLRVGLVSESIVVPGVSFTYLKRDLPTSTISGTATYTAAPLGQTTAALNITNAKVNTSAWRVVASKSLIFFGVAAGVGQDKYDQSADISATVNSTLGGSQTVSVPGTSQSMTRTNYFLDASVNILLLKITGEVGQVTGGTVNTFNSLQGGRADQSRTYGSVGIRVGI